MEARESRWVVRKSRDPVPVDEAARKAFVSSDALFRNSEAGGSGGGEIGLDEGAESASVEGASEGAGGEPVSNIES